MEGTEGPEADPLVLQTPVEPSLGRPAAIVRQELIAFLDADQSRLGEVFRGLQRNLTADQIAAELGVSTSNFVWNYQRTIETLIDANLPRAPTVALQTARRVRTILKQRHLSTGARSYLEGLLEDLEQRANDETARVVETERAKQLTETAESLDQVGIYVYALPHYLRYPFDPETGRTLMKVGRSDSDVIRRFREQTRTTALPEEPILLRIYKSESAATSATESDFHRLLEAADHSRSVARTAGRERFVTSTRFLDEVARVMRLEVVIVNDADVVEDL